MIQDGGGRQPIPSIRFPVALRCSHLMEAIVISDHSSVPSLDTGADVGFVVFMGPKQMWLEGL